MERDFLGLSWKESLPVVKEEVSSDGYKDIGFTKGSTMQWSFSNKVSAVPQSMSFNVTQGDKAKKIGSDTLVFPGYMPISTTDAYESCRKHSTTEIQMFPVSNQATSVSLSNPFFKNHFSTSSQNLAGNTMKQLLIGGIPVTTPHSILPTFSPVCGSIEPWKSFKASGSPAPMTIFYAGTVNVYDDITPEKAQAIMFLAENGSSVASTMVHPKLQIHAPSSKQVLVDNVPASQPINTLPGSGLSSPVSVSSHTGVQPKSGSTSTDELMAAKTRGNATTAVSKVEPPKVVNSMGPFTPTSMIPSVPQARKASLARFLEKRKERVMNAAPYNLSKKSLEVSTPESIGMNFVATSAAGTGSVAAS